MLESKRSEMHGFCLPPLPPQEWLGGDDSSGVCQ
jgi:hypothetical protein